VRTIQRGEIYAEQKYFGCYRAIVLNNDDPRRLGRVILQVPEIFGTDLQTDWAYPKTGFMSAGNSSGTVPVKPQDQPVDGPAVGEPAGVPYVRSDRDGDKGDFCIPDISDGVWAEFEAGDPCRPLWSGRWWSEPAGGPETPMLARELTDESQMAPKGTDVMITATDQELFEPPISFNPLYPTNRVLKTQTGIIVEIDDGWDDAAGSYRPRIHLWHPARTWIEMHPQGDRVDHVANRQYVYIEKDNDLHVKGNYNIHVEGDCTLHVKGNFIRHIEGDEVSRIDGNKTEFVGGFKQSTVVGAVTQVSEERIDSYAPEQRRTADSHIGDYAPRVDHNGPGAPTVMP
jgi:hypothetical protein